MSYFEQLQHMKIHGKPEKEKTYSRPKPKSDKKLAEEAAAKENGTDAAIDKWFNDRGEEMTGVCLFCGGATTKAKQREFYSTDEMYEKALFLQRNSAAHLFAKKKEKFPSIALHPVNMIELCFFGNSCHTNFDTHMIELEDVKFNWPKAWEVIVEKTKILYHCMTEKEKNKVPEILLQAIGVHQ